MGNTYSAKTQRTLATAAMAKYMNVNKPQLMRLRDIVLPYSKSTQGLIERSYVEYGLGKSVESNNPTSDANNKDDDPKILGHLFTLCDTGNGQVDFLEFIVGISVLACKADSFEVAIRFALRVLDVTGVGEIDSRNAFKLLRGTFSLRGNRPWIILSSQFLLTNIRMCCH
jgi:Ca2+-binding EF-hand superfamily protein